MRFSDHPISPLGQTFGAELNAKPPLTSGSFVQCPSALLQGKSEEQMCELASIYQQAYEQALKSVQKRTVALRRLQFPLDDSLRGIGWN